MQSKMGAGLPRVATSGYIDGVAQGKGEMKMRMKVRVRECHRVYFRVFVVYMCVSECMCAVAYALRPKRTESEENSLATIEN